MNKNYKITNDDLILVFFLLSFFISYNLICFMLRKMGFKISKNMLRITSEKYSENPADLLQPIIAIFSIFIAANLMQILFN